MTMVVLYVIICFFIGCTVEFKFNSGFDLEKCRMALKNYTAHVSRTEFDKVQILLSDSELSK